MSIYYHKIDKYILTIIVNDENCSTFNNIQINNPLHALYFTKQVLITSIEDFTTNKFHTKIELNPNYILEINNEYNFMEYIGIFKTRECAFYYNFIPHKDYELFESGYSGIVKTFDPEGNLICTTFMNNSAIL
jgi:hypothetical protein